MPNNGFIPQTVALRACGVSGLSNQESPFEQPADIQPQPPAAIVQQQPGGISNEQNFASAVLETLRNFNRPDRLRDNPLINSQLIARALAQSPLPPHQALRNLILAHCELLAQSPKYNRHRRVLEQTYLTPLRRQRAVADALHLSWGTYRHCLRDALRILTASLWEAECLLQKPSPHRSAPGTVHIFRPWLTIAAVLALIILAGVVYLPRHRRREEESKANFSSAVAAAAPANNYQQDISGTRDFYLIGMNYLNERTGPGIEQAIRNFRKSIQMDANNATAWAALAMAYAVLHTYSDEQPPDAHYDDALSAANRAIALDPAQPTAHAVLGFLHARHWEWPQARREFELALRLDPYETNAHRWYAKYFWLTGDVQQALTYARAASTLDPDSPVVKANLGRALAYVGELNQAENVLRTGVAAAPHFALYYDYLAETHAAMKQYAQVLNDAKTAVKTTGTPPSAYLLMESGVAEAATGHNELARKYLAALQQQALAHYVSGVLTAKLYWDLGDKGHCFAELQRAVREHDDNLMIISGPDWTTIRADPRYVLIRQQMGLPTAEEPLH